MNVEVCLIWNSWWDYDAVAFPSVKLHHGKFISASLYYNDEFKITFRRSSWDIIDSLNIFIRNIFISSRISFGTDYDLLILWSCVCSILLFWLYVWTRAKRISFSKCEGFQKVNLTVSTWFVSLNWACLIKGYILHISFLVYSPYSK